MTMRYYPVYLDIQNRNCLVVGGGGVATRKVVTLLNCRARVTVVSPELSERLRRHVNQGSVAYHQRSYRASDLDGMFLVIGATNNREINKKIYRDAERLGTLCNIADQPNACNFILPSVVSRGDLLIAISTSGKSPALSKRLRQDLEKQFGEEYATFLKLMGAVRNKLLSQDHNPEAHRAVFEQLIDKGLLNGLKDQDKEVVDSLLHEILGKGYDYRSLMETKNN